MPGDVDQSFACRESMGNMPMMMPRDRSTRRHSAQLLCEQLVVSAGGRGFALFTLLPLLSVSWLWDVNGSNSEIQQLVSRCVRYPSLAEQADSPSSKPFDWEWRETGGFR